MGVEFGFLMLGETGWQGVLVSRRWEEVHDM